VQCRGTDDCKNTLVCAFSKDNPRISTLDIHEWIHAKLRFPENEVRVVQINAIRRQVFIKVRDTGLTEDLIYKNNGTIPCEHQEGVLSQLRISMAELRTRRVRIANLPPELPTTFLMRAQEKYGTVFNVKADTWAAAYRYRVPNGIQIVTIDLKVHIPSQFMVAGHRALASYKGQPLTCYVCNEAGHLVNQCPSGIAISAGWTCWGVNRGQ
jgi:hypothetical protein